MSLRLIASSMVQLADGRFRMYIEARRISDRPTVITSAISEDQLVWQHEERVDGPAVNEAASTSSVPCPGTVSTSCSNRAKGSAADRNSTTPQASPWDNCWLHPVPGPWSIRPGRTPPPEELDFAAASIAADISRFRSRIFQAMSEDGLSFRPPEYIVAGGSYDSNELDAVHADDMSVITLGDGRKRMYYAACDTTGRWRFASAGTGC